MCLAKQAAGGAEEGKAVCWRGGKAQIRPEKGVLAPKRVRMELKARILPRKRAFCAGNVLVLGEKHEFDEKNEFLVQKS